MHKIKSKMVSTVAGVALASLSTTAAFAVTWNMPTGYGDTNFHTQNAKRFAEAVTTATNGELTIKVHSHGSLFKGSEIKRAVQRGQAFIGERLLSAHANELQILATDSLPFIATSFQESKLLWQAAKPVINRNLEKQNLKILYSVSWPPQGFYTKKPVRKIEDFAGMKMRGYNTITSAVSKAVKAEPLQIGAAELPQALATGIADSFVSSGSVGNDIKVWETLKYYNDFRGWLPRNYVIVNLEEWNKLPKNIQATVESIAKLTEHGANQEVQVLTGWYLDNLRANGMEVTIADDKLRNALAERTKFMLDEYLKKSGKDGKEIIDRYNALKAKAGLK